MYTCSLCDYFFIDDELCDLSCVCMYSPAAGVFTWLGSSCPVLFSYGSLVEGQPFSSLYRPCDQVGGVTIPLCVYCHMHVYCYVFTACTVCKCPNRNSNRKLNF